MVLMHAAVVLAALAAPAPAPGEALVPKGLPGSATPQAPEFDGLPRRLMNWSAANPGAMSWSNIPQAVGNQPLPSWNNVSNAFGNQPLPSWNNISDALGHAAAGAGAAPNGEDAAKVQRDLQKAHNMMGNTSKMNNFTSPQHSEPEEDQKSEGVPGEVHDEPAKASPNPDTKNMPTAPIPSSSRAPTDPAAAASKAAEEANAAAKKLEQAKKAAASAEAAAQKAGMKAVAPSSGADTSNQPDKQDAPHIKAPTQKTWNASAFAGAFAPVLGMSALVTTECGDVKGVTTPTFDGKSKVDVFHGIKYATAARWELPVPLTTAGLCWGSATYDATVKPRPCVGLDGDGIEDCLTMTVYTPSVRANGANMPIVAFFHGGDLVDGAAEGESDTEGVVQNFGMPATHGSGMVWADINYRLGLAGFLSTDAMGDKGAFGFQDALESLRWLKRNGAAFSGDPNRITVMGQSSGGTVALVLAASPLSRGLMSGVISLSGAANVSMTRDVQRRQHNIIIKNAGCLMPTAEATMSCLKAMPLTQGSPLLKATPQSEDSHAPGTEESPSWGNLAEWDIPRQKDGMRDPGLAVVDGTVLRKPLWDALAQDADPSVPVIISTMAQEQAGAAPFKFKVAGMSPEQFRESLRVNFAWNDDRSAPVPFGYLVADQYAKKTAISPVLAAYSLAADVQVGCGSMHTARHASMLPGRTAPVYFVHNEMRKPGIPTGGTCDQGTAFHGLDLGQTSTSTTPRAEKLRSYWYEFATTGKVASWMQATPDAATMPSVRLGKDAAPNNVVNWKGMRCDFWKQYGLGGPEQWWSN